MEVMLRKWERADAPALAKAADNPKVEKNLRDGFASPYTLQDAQAFIQMCREGDERPLYGRAIVVDGKIAGSIALSFGDNVHSRSAEIAYFLAEPYWGKGITTRAVELMCADGFENHGLLRIFAEPYRPNQASCRVLEKAGFTREGILRDFAVKQGQIMDCCMYALLRREWDM